MVNIDKLARAIENEPVPKIVSVLIAAAIDALTSGGDPAEAIGTYGVQTLLEWAENEAGE